MLKRQNAILWDENKQLSPKLGGEEAYQKSFGAKDRLTRGDL